MAASSIQGPAPAFAALQSALDALGVPARPALGALVIDGGKIFVKAAAASTPASTTVRFDLFLAQAPDRIASRTSTWLDASDAEPAQALETVCRDWALACLEPVRRALDEQAREDGAFHLYVSADRQVPFHFYYGPYLVQGEQVERWSRRFSHSLFDWFVSRGTLRYPDRRFAVLRLGMRATTGGGTEGLSRLDGQPWPAADERLASLEWPGPAPQQLLNYVVLRRIDVPPRRAAD